MSLAPIDNPDAIVEKRDQMVYAWAGFINYVTKTSLDGLAQASISILVKNKTPLAWQVNWQSLPQDIPPQNGDSERKWMSFVGHLLAMAKNNNGYAIIDSDILTYDRQPAAWLEARVRRIYPMGIMDLWGDELIMNILFPRHIKAKAQAKLTG